MVLPVLVMTLALCSEPQAATPAAQSAVQTAKQIRIELKKLDDKLVAEGKQKPRQATSKSGHSEIQMARSSTIEKGVAKINCPFVRKNSEAFVARHLRR